MAALEAEKLEIWEQLRCLDPVLAGEIKVDAPNFVQMQKLIDQPTSAILSFYTTAQNLHIFILRQNQITLHTCPDQRIEPLQGWISQNWLQPYAASCHPNRPKPEREQLRAEWVSQISPFLTELAQRLQLTDLIAKHHEPLNDPKAEKMLADFIEFDRQTTWLGLAIMIISFVCFVLIEVTLRSY